MKTQQQSFRALHNIIAQANLSIRCVALKQAEKEMEDLFCVH